MCGDGRRNSDVLCLHVGRVAYVSLASGNGRGNRIWAVQQLHCSR